MNWFLKQVERSQSKSMCQGRRHRIKNRSEMWVANPRIIVDTYLCFTHPLRPNSFKGIRLHLYTKIQLKYKVLGFDFDKKKQYSCREK